MKISTFTANLASVLFTANNNSAVWVLFSLVYQSRLESVVTLSKHLSSRLWVDFPATFKNHLLGLEFGWEYSVIFAGPLCYFFAEFINQISNATLNPCSCFFVSVSLWMFGRRLEPFTLQLIIKITGSMNSRDIWFSLSFNAASLTSQGVFVTQGLSAKFSALLECFLLTKSFQSSFTTAYLLISRGDARSEATTWL
jgi:hypothetical protein